MPKYNMPTLDIAKDSPIDLLFLNDVLKHIENSGLVQNNIPQSVLEILAYDNESMRKLNANFMGKDNPTDVLSFPLVYNYQSQDYPSEAPLCLGSIVINYEMAKEVANKLGHSIQDEVALLFVHGFLHILGYDHETDNGEQRRLEQKIIESLSMKESLIVRGEKEN